jgi:hypothetical protein
MDYNNKNSKPLRIYDMIYLLTAVGLTPGGNNTVHIYTQTIHRTTQLTILVGRLSGIRTQIGQTNWEECGPCPVFVSYTLTFALQLREKHKKKSLSQGSRRVPFGMMKTEYTEQNIHEKIVIRFSFYRMEEYYSQL